MQQSLNKWQLIHTYQRMVSEGSASELRCPDDDFPYYTKLDHSTPDEPVFHCTFCNANVRYGSLVWDQILAVVKTKYDIILEK